MLEGLCSAAPRRRSAERGLIEQPALVIGHPSDPLHPFSDSDMLVEEMPNARLVDANRSSSGGSTPGRLDDELAAFLDEVSTGAPAEARPPLALIGRPARRHVRSLIAAVTRKRGAPAPERLEAERRPRPSPRG